MIEGRWAGGENHHGHEGVRNLWSQFREAWGEMRNVPEDLIDLGDRVLVLVHFSARGSHTGIEFDQRVAHLWEWRDGQVIRLTLYPDRAAGLKEAGVP